ncbi:hypothetical protein [Shouchella miscanthi]|uniref:hypothetical protein n=1 Tax=Shouchella miscanthi TaxID=2598861 RepID=UPI00119EDE98|nr:hypothetical protein [Shouchella miscanthi]
MFTLGGSEILVFNTSLIGKTFCIADILNRVKGKSNLMIIESRSLLKLEQQGMEFCNSGLVQTFLPEKAVKLTNYVYEHMKKNRSVMGTSVNFYELCLIDNVLFIGDNNYANDVLNNNKYFHSKLLHTNGIFIDRIIYPYKDNDPDYHRTPYIYIKLTKDKKESYELLYNLIDKIFKDFELSGVFRNSFGFRNISMEYFMNLKDKSLVFKIAPGKLNGVKYFLSLVIFNYLLKFPNNKEKRLEYIEFAANCEGELDEL